MHFDVLIRNGTLVTPAGLVVADLGITNGLIADIDARSGADADRIIDAEHLLILPGVIDTQVHFREPGLEHKEDIESGTRAAIMGGVTTIFEMPNTLPPTTTAEALADKLQRAEGRAWCNYSFFVGATTENMFELGELEKLPGTPGIKIFMGSSTGTLLVSEENDLREVLRNGKHRCPVHAEDEARNRARRGLLSGHPHAREHPNLRDAESAKIATDRILRLSAETGRPVHILHVSTADELPLIARAKQSGLNTTAEITPQHLWFQAPDCYEALGSLAQMNPPIRSGEHRDALRRALADGLFDMIGSDHAPHTIEEKAKPYPQSPSGMPGVQTLLPVMLTLVSQGLLPLEQLVEMTSRNPARLYGLRGKGELVPGYDADLVLVDPEAERVFERPMVESKCGWSPYEGEKLTGWPVHVLLRGQTVVQDGERVGLPSGRPVDFSWK